MSEGGGRPEARDRPGPAGKAGTAGYPEVAGEAGTPADQERSEGERLQKVLARIGLGSRRVCEDLIDSGRITVNGEIPVLGRRVRASMDRICLDGVPLSVRPDLVHYLLNKPFGTVSTVSDTYGRPTVVSLVPPSPRVFPVGRLDRDTEGLLILTNDGELAQRLTHPSYGVWKEYLAEVEGVPSRAALRSLREGVELDDGPTAPARVSNPAPNLVRVAIHEGRNRQVRRMCAAVGHPVVRLVRTRIGPLADATLSPGQWRHLTPAEVRALWAAAEAVGLGPSSPDDTALRSGPRAPGGAGPGRSR